MGPGGAPQDAADGPLVEAVPFAELVEDVVGAHGGVLQVGAALPLEAECLVDVEDDELVSIADGRAIFRASDGYRTLGVGDAVYLGRVVLIDPERSRVVAYLNRGGIVDEVELTVGTPGVGTYRPTPLPEQPKPTGPVSSLEGAPVPGAPVLAGATRH